jgi:hypothetical protein
MKSAYPRYGALDRRPSTLVRMSQSRRRLIGSMSAIPGPPGPDGDVAGSATSAPIAEARVGNAVAHSSRVRRIASSTSSDASATTQATTRRGCQPSRSAAPTAPRTCQSSDRSIAPTSSIRVFTSMTTSVAVASWNARMSIQPRYRRSVMRTSRSTCHPAATRRRWTYAEQIAWAASAGPDAATCTGPRATTSTSMSSASRSAPITSRLGFALPDSSAATICREMPLRSPRLVFVQRCSSRPVRTIAPMRTPSRIRRADRRRRCIAAFKPTPLNRALSGRHDWAARHRQWRAINERAWIGTRAALPEADPRGTHRESATTSGAERVSDQSRKELDRQRHHQWRAMNERACIGAQAALPDAIHEALVSRAPPPVAPSVDALAADRRLGRPQRGTLRP